MMKQVEAISESGNRYIYDNVTGLVYLDNEKALTVEKYDLYKNSQNIVDFEKCNQVTSEDIKEYLYGKGNGFNQILFEMTSECNLRCKYCIYSDHYMFTKSYSNKYMSFDIAKKALDYYFENFEKVVYRNPSKKPSIGFYGGEPLMNMNVMSQLVEYVNSAYGNKYEIIYNVTTNGLLLNEDAIDFLVDNNFAITLSIDGNEVNHDRNRIRVDGTGSHEHIMKNVKLLRTKYPDYERVAVSACYDFRTNLLELEKFFDENKLFLSKLAPVDLNNTTYYNQFTQEEIKEFQANLQCIKDKYLQKLKSGELKKDSFLYSFIGVMFAEFYLHPIMAEGKPWFIPRTSCCVPGEKMYVTNDGKIHMCEKINSNFSIGNVDEGIDFDKICAIIRKYNSQVCRKNCEGCSVSRLCTVCYAQVAQEDGFGVNKKYCSNKVEEVRDILKESVEILEEVAHALDDITLNYYKEIYARAGEMIG